MTDAFEEVEEQVRRDRYEKLLRTYGPWALGLLIAALVIVGGWRFYASWSEGQTRERSVAFVAAQREARGGEVKGAEPTFEQMTKDGPGVYRELALMEIGAIEVNKGDLAAALATFDEAAKIAGDPIVRDTARIRAAYIAADTEDFAAVRARLEPLIEEEGPFSYLARELLGVEAWEAGEFDLARRTIAPLPTAFDTPTAARERARLLLAVLGPGAESTNTEASASTEAPPRGEEK